MNDVAEVRRHECCMQAHSTVATITEQTTPAQLRGRRTVQLAQNVGVAGAWLWLFRPLAEYFGVIFTKEDFRTNQIALVAIVGLLLYRIWQSRGALQLDVAPRLHRLPLLLVVAGSLGYLVCSRLLDINTLESTLFGLATYGLVGLWLSPARWRAGLPAALLLIGVLPFAEHLQTFIGYPMRIVTAEIVRQGLAALGVGSIGVDTILIFENGVSQVDIPCSGVKSLWTGALFLIAATWIDRRPINLRWLWVALAFAGLLFVANLARVAGLVVVGEVLHWRPFAEMIHVPLGVLSFMAACLGALFLLKNVERTPASAPSANVPAPQPRWLAPSLIVGALVLSMAYAPRPHTGLQQTAPTWRFAPLLHTQPRPLRADELDWLSRDGADSADRFNFSWRAATGDALAGSMMLIPSHTWRAHHRPERCFEVVGLALNDSGTHLIAPDFPVRVVSLGGTDAQPQATAVYWFQSAQRVTDDYGTRMWADLAPKPQRWVLITMLFERDLDPGQPEATALLNAVRATVQRELTKAP